MEKSLLFSLFLLIFSLFSFSEAEIKDLNIAADSRPLILFEKFGFSPHGYVSMDVSEVTFASSLSPSDPSLLGFLLLSEANIVQSLFESQHQNPNSNCILSSPYARVLFTFRDLKPPPFNSLNRTYSIALPDEYSLFFANCNQDCQVSMSVRTMMFNSLPDGSRDYLSIGRSPVPSLYSVFALIYILFLSIWIYFGLFKNRSSSHRIHYLMAGLLFAKALNLIFAAEDQHYVRTTGTPRGWDVLFYLFQFIKGILLVTVIVLIGTGWSFLKPFLQDREKKILMIAIPLQVIANVASTVIGETGPFMKYWGTWVQVLLLIDIVCCGAILLPLVWSMRSLRETAKTDGKAARNLAKLTLFRRFYIVVVGYLYFTRIVVFALKVIASYKYQWLGVAAEEAASLGFYMFMFSMFRPKEKNEYLVLDDDEEAEAEVALRREEFEL